MQPLLERMLSLIRHRGPDEFGIYLDEQVGLGSARLSIIDLTTGSQPITNEDRTVWIVFNGEIFNYVELRPELEAMGHRFTTDSDTEVILHLYESYGPQCVERLNGQFAFVIWDRRPQAGSGTLFAARDRVGICPFFYTIADGKLIWASEVKAMLAHPAVSARLDPIGLAQTFTLWTTIAPRTVFEGIQMLPPGHMLMVRDGKVTTEPYWTLDFPDRHATPEASDEAYIAELRELLIDATRIRLRADVPVGAYLSGGLDSSSVAAIVRQETGNYLRTFSVAFTDPNFDERTHQNAMIKYLGTDHASIECAEADIGRVFPDVIWHTEWPILRTSPAPLYLLSSLVRDHEMKVVLTGEGSDEFLGGYTIYKEAKLRRFWARVPDSELRPLLLRKLYPYVTHLDEQEGMLRAFFGQDLTATDRLDYSHAIRWANTAPLRRLFSPELREMLGAYDPVAEVSEHLAAHPRFASWSPLAQAQYIEITIFLSSYLLSSQGDRMLMAHSVEGRFPFMDHRVIELANRMPPSLKIRGLNEKFVLKQAMKGRVPDYVRARVKQPYRAPIHRSFFSADAPAYIRDMLSPAAIESAGYFHPGAVTRLLRKAEQGLSLSERDNMALAGMLSTQLLHAQFVADFPQPATPHLSPLRVYRGTSEIKGETYAVSS